RRLPAPAPGRGVPPAPRWFEPIARAHGAFDVSVADLAEWNLPFLDEPKHPKLREYTKEHTMRWSAEVDAADAFVFVMPEYNHGFNAPLKNAIDYLHQEWQHKPAGFVSYGGVAAGRRAVQQLKQVLISLNMLPVNDAVAIQFIAKQIEDGELVVGEILEQAADAMLTELSRVAEAARSLREAAQPASSSRSSTTAVPRVEDYAMIGDLQTAALIGRDGSIDWCCFPRFDSGACFARLLGDAGHGRWLLAPAGGITHATRRYRSDTLILESIYDCAEGRVRAIDFMPPRGDTPDIVRIVESLDGEVPMRSELVIRFDYGSIVPW